MLSSTCQLFTGILILTSTEGLDRGWLSTSLYPWKIMLSANAVQERLDSAARTTWTQPPATTTANGRKNFLKMSTKSVQDSQLVAKDVTIYAVKGTLIPEDGDPTGTDLPAPSFTMSPIGVNSDGATTYDAVFQVPSGQPEHVTYVAAATQIAYTVVTAVGVQIDATTTSTFTVPDATQARHCSWGPERNQGTCVVEVNGRPRRTWTGTVGPFYTLTVQNSAILRSSSSSALMFTLLVGFGVVIALARVFAL